MIWVHLWQYTRFISTCIFSCAWIQFVPEVPVFKTVHLPYPFFVCVYKRFGFNLDCLWILYGVLFFGLCSVRFLHVVDLTLCCVLIADRPRPLQDWERLAFFLSQTCPVSGAGSEVWVTGVIENPPEKDRMPTCSPHTSGQQGFSGQSVLEVIIHVQLNLKLCSMMPERKAWG